jgi:hypothetical protein
MFVIQYQSHRAGTDLRRELVAVCLLMAPLSQELEPPATRSSSEKHEPVSDIDTVVVDSLKALDPEWPIREADIS